MRTTIRYRDLSPTLEVERAVEKELRRALDPHGSRLLSVRASLAPSPPIQGAGRWGCELRVRLRDGSRLVGEDHASSPAEAAAGAAGRIAQRIELTRRLPLPQHRGVAARRHPLRIGGSS